MKWREISICKLLTSRVDRGRFPAASQTPNRDHRAGTRAKANLSRSAKYPRRHTPRKRRRISIHELASCTNKTAHTVASRSSAAPHCFSSARRVSLRRWRRSINSKALNGKLRPTSPPWHQQATPPTARQPPPPQSPSRNVRSPGSPPRPAGV